MTTSSQGTGGASLPRAPGHALGGSVQEQRLFRLAHEAVSITAAYVGGQGWSVTVRLRRGDESWSDAYSAQYSHLSTSEMVDVIECELLQLL